MYHEEVEYTPNIIINDKHNILFGVFLQQIPEKVDSLLFSSAFSEMLKLLVLYLKKSTIKYIRKKRNAKTWQIFCKG